MCGRYLKWAIPKSMREQKTPWVYTPQVNPYKNLLRYDIT